MERSTVTYRIPFESAGAGSALVVAGRGGGIVESLFLSSHLTQAFPPSPVLVYMECYEYF